FLSRGELRSNAITLKGSRQGSGANSGANSECPPSSPPLRAAQAARPGSRSIASRLPPRKEQGAEVRIPALLPARGRSYRWRSPAGRFPPDPRVAPVEDRPVSLPEFHSPASYPGQQPPCPER